ncbi:unnamed protein product [Vitrella brassicaformis CCMP3155]|uniref:VWFD domain-containing protein n=1 Tax=Vitrella brassicaformis (strain CCMP3155) TaxID=1169540 RepID=A0A0G4GYJ6_VITBC|nr:unnamed protein product [Vitrella brassicaformis CCMP3155]|mmetsp:Transcript_19248/g.46460  ORF Transcript_19248/g.46460 Transcript_19248/m.46460 type:complete len:269 (-) Transcript_19248:683-1489(-)|eukprot:CEM36234.1 unnamed protein product [Vitrella brassicaformis CCMP3155]
MSVVPNALALLVAAALCCAVAASPALRKLQIFGDDVEIDEHGVIRTDDDLATPVQMAPYYHHLPVSSILGLNLDAVSKLESVHLTFNDTSEFYGTVQSFIKTPSGIIVIHMGGGWELVVSYAGMTLIDKDGTVAKEVFVEIQDENGTVVFPTASTNDTRTLMGAADFEEFPGMLSRANVGVQHQGREQWIGQFGRDGNESLQSFIKGCADMTGCGSLRVGLAPRVRGQTSPRGVTSSLAPSDLNALGNLDCEYYARGGCDAAAESREF